MRTSTIKRTTKETDILLTLDLDGTGNSSISTGIPFLNHMLTAFTLYSGINLDIKATGDLEVDDHHLIEDIGIVLGQAFLESLGDKKGITRFADNMTPMDEVLIQVVLDISNRPYLDFNGEFNPRSIGGFSLEMVEEFFYAFAIESRITLHIDVLKGKNDHHKVEGIFKAVGRALNVAKAQTSNQLLSTKGTLT